MMDLYCERLGPGLWAEPLNAVTNLAYFAAAAALWRRSRFAGTQGIAPVLLVGLLAAVGAGSLLFHTFATPWARFLDVLPILVFEALFLWLYTRQVAARSSVLATTLAAAFVALAVAARQFPDVLNGSLFYAPAVAVILGVGLHDWRTNGPEPLVLLAGAGAFSAAIVCRIVDRIVCPSFPWGTHFLWHLLTAVAAYCLARVLIAKIPSRVVRV